MKDQEIKDLCRHMEMDRMNTSRAAHVTCDDNDAVNATPRRH